MVSNDFVADCCSPKTESLDTLWQDNGKHCSVWLAGARTNREGAAMFFDDLLADPQAQAISYRTFGREERLKNLG